MGSFRPVAGNPHLHGYYNFTESLVETVPRSINLGMMPPEPDFHVVEVWPDQPALPEAVKDRRVLHASDAHQLGNIREAVFDIPTERFSFGGLWTWLHDFHR